jgi:zinc D-Ala-D-Ala dipeptidase
MRVLFVKHWNMQLGNMQMFFRKIAVVLGALLIGLSRLSASSTISFSQVPIIECGEAIIDLKGQHIIAYVNRGLDENDLCYTKVRRSVYDKLCQAQALLPPGCRFLIYCGWRSLEQQQIIFDRKTQKLRTKFPHMSDEEIFTEAAKMVAPVSELDGRPNVPPHSTGGAIDVCLMDEENHPLDMGALLEKTLDIDPDILRTDSSTISEIAKYYRNIMSLALSSVGFVNNEREYWHWSYGDRRWALKTKSNHAIYGSL